MGRYRPVKHPNKHNKHSDDKNKLSNEVIVNTSTAIEFRMKAYKKFNKLNKYLGEIDTRCNITFKFSTNLMC